jgi:Fungal calcium binding protein
VLKVPLNEKTINPATLEISLASNPITNFTQSHQSIHRIISPKKSSKMQFTATTVAAHFAVSATALPAQSDASQMAQIQSAASGWNILGCITALGPAAVTCAAAIAQEGIDVPNDLACIAGVLADVATVPSACDSC